VKTLNELQSRLREIVQRMDGLDKAATEKGEDFLQNAEYVALRAEVEPLEEQIRAAESAEAADAERAKRAELAARSNQKKPGLEDTGKFGNFHNRAEDAPFRNFGEFLQCVRNAAVQPSGIDPRLQKRAALGSNENVGQEGGFLVGKDVAASILEDMHEVGVLAPKCQGIPISSNSNSIVINGVDETSRADGSRYGGVQAYWASEAGTATASKPKFRQIDLKLGKLFAFYR
jgi:HK97 family phage major capsid protein